MWVLYDMSNDYKLSHSLPTGSLPLLPPSLPSSSIPPLSTSQACMQVCPKNPSNFNVDNVRVAKILGAGLADSYVVGGMVLKLDATGTIKKAEKAKVSW